MDLKVGDKIEVHADRSGIAHGHAVWLLAELTVGGSVPECRVKIVDWRGVPHREDTSDFFLHADWIRPVALKVGQIWNFAGQARRITELTPYIRTAKVEGGDLGGIWDGEDCFREHHTFVSEPKSEPKSEHPADLKPRTGKAPLYLIPWCCVPENLVPPEILRAAQATGFWPCGAEYTEGHEDTDEDMPRLDFLATLLGEIVNAYGWDDIALAFEYGANKYERDNWKSFTWDQAAEDSYMGAIYRHLVAVSRGEERAEDSGVRHSGHVGAGCLIQLWHYTYGEATK